MCLTGADITFLTLSNPVRHVEKPQAGRRDVVITPDEYAWILGRVRDDPFRDLRVVC